MKSRCAIVAACAWFAACSAGWAFDTVKLVPTGTVAGEVSKMSPLTVAVKQGAVDRDVPVNQIASIIYDGIGTTQSRELLFCRFEHGFHPLHCNLQG